MKGTQSNNYLFSGDQRTLLTPSETGDNVTAFYLTLGTQVVSNFTT